MQFTILTAFVHLINTNKFAGFLFLLGFILIPWLSWKVVCDLLTAITQFFKERAEAIYLSNRKFSITPTTTTLTMDERVDLTGKVIDLITDTIQLEVAKWLAPKVRLSEEIKISYLDETASDIAVTVKDSLSKDIFTDPNLLYTTEYLQKFIISSTIQIATEAAINHNNDLRAHALE